MYVFYLISTVVFSISVIANIIRTKKILTIPTIIFLSVTINFILYLLHWSDAIAEPVYDVTYYVIGMIQLIFSVYATAKNQGISTKVRYRLKSISLGAIKCNLSTILLLSCLFLCMTENYLMFGGFFASNSSSHTSSIPLLSPILKALYPVAGIAAFIDFDNTKKKGILLLASVVLIYSVIGAKGRMWTLIALFIVLMYMSSRRYGAIVRKKSSSWFVMLKLRYKVLLVAAVVFSGSYLLNMGATRINTFTYAQLLKYTGPGEGKVYGDILAWYYGYFPFSFYNLNTTLNDIVISGRYSFGQFLLYPYTSFVHVSGILGIDYSTLTYTTRVIQINVATVATGYYEFFKDFGYFFFISVLIYIAITRYFEKRSTYFAKTGYSYMAIVWLFMSFLNVYTVGVVIYFFVIEYCIGRWFAAPINQ